MWHDSGVAVAGSQASSCSSDSTPSLGTSIGHGHKKKNLKKKKKEEKKTPLSVGWDPGDEDSPTAPELSGKEGVGGMGSLG